MKILITGGLGYIGTSLVERLIKTQYCLDEIIVTDSNFIPERVDWLKNNYVKFYHKDLFSIGDIVRDVGLVFHLAGVTAVPQVASQSTPEKDKEIYKIGVEGTRAIISNLDKDAKIVFSSTHVVFEGTNKDKPLTETDAPRPLLAYGISKLFSEDDLLFSDKRFTIVRLASVYGYNENVRWKILPNLFSKMTAMDGKIKVFGKDCIKPLVGVNDCARALEFLSNKKFDGHIFHLSNEHLTVDEIAMICKSIRPNLVVEYTDDAVINKGYKLSNEKLLKAGFIFEDDIESSINNMIEKWSNLT